ncbi:MAG TPA: DHA2 family efflux MFS transporter permease subunit [Streptosporangiaceae bacterium]|jgi:EmrB/QacA subfamily drug resistance transporter
MTTAAGADEQITPALRRLTWILVLGSLAPSLDTTIVNVALAAIGTSLHTSVGTSQWTITGYLLTMAMAMPVTGWAAARAGAKRMWLGSLSLFLAGSVASGAAWNVGSLIVFRLIQGAGAGLMLPIVTTLLVQAAGPKRLGRLMAVASLPMVIVPIFGPVVSGLIIHYLSWRWIFYVNVPICGAALVLAWRLAPASPPAAQPPRLDILGLALLSPGLALVTYGLSEATGHSGFASTGVLLPLTAGLALIAAFAGHALRTPRPLVNLRVLRIRSFAAAATVLFLAGLSLYGPLLLLSLYYQQVRGISAIMTGLILAPQGIGSLLPRTVAGKLTDRIGPRLVVITSLVLTIAGTLAFTQAGPASNEWLLAISLLVRGAGLAGVTIAVTAGAFQRVPRAEVPDASSTVRIVLQVGGSFGSAVLAIVLAHQLARGAATAAAHAMAFNTAFWWSIGFSVLALPPALLLARMTGKKAGPQPGQGAAASAATPARTAERG